MENGVPTAAVSEGAESRLQSRVPVRSCVSMAAAASRGRDQQIGGSLRPRTAVGKSQRGLAVGRESQHSNPAKISTVLTSLGAE